MIWRKIYNNIVFTIRIECLYQVHALFFGNPAAILFITRSTNALDTAVNSKLCYMESCPIPPIDNSYVTLNSIIVL